MRIVAIALVLVASLSVGAAHAADRFVSTKGDDQGGANPCNPTPCKTIAQALVQVSTGDVIKVAKGSYKGSLAISGPGTWTIRGGYGPDFSEATREVVRNKTIVTGDKNNRFLSIVSSGDVITVTLDGFVVSNSKETAPGLSGGGGILALTGVGGIHLSLNEVTMTGNRGEHGGALRLFADDGTIEVHITSSLFRNNRASVAGGAIRVDHPMGRVTVSIQDSRFEGNTASTGGAISVSANARMTAEIFRSIFLGNGASATGGAIDVFADDSGEGISGRVGLTVENSVLQGNTAGDAGGAVALRALVAGTRLVSGTAKIEVDLRNNTVAGNKAGGSAGGLAAFADSSADDVPSNSSLVAGALLNNIIRGNAAKAFPASGDILFISDGEGASTAFDLVTNNIGLLANFGTVTATPNPQLNVDPQLVKQQGVFRLKPTSPMIDAGTCDDAPLDDFEGDARPKGLGCDIGADEC